MIDIDITYDTLDGSDRGETCTSLTVCQEVYTALTGKHPDEEERRICTAWLESTLEGIEALCGRDYVRGSIKDIRKAGW